jgi:hypothetical protein
MSEPTEVVVLNPGYWADRAPQLAAIFGQDRVPSPLGDPSGMKPNPEWMVTFVDPGYWASQPRELQDALNEAAGSGVRPSSGLGAGAAAVPTSHVGLTYTVEEAAEVLGISRAFAYEASSVRAAAHQDRAANPHPDHKAAGTALVSAHARREQLITASSDSVSANPDRHPVSGNPDGMTMS